MLDGRQVFAKMLVKSEEGQTGRRADGQEGRRLGWKCTRHIATADKVS